MPALEKTFDCAYDATALAELPSDHVERLYYPGASPEGGRDGMIVEVKPARRAAWIGVFAFGDKGSRAVSGLYSLPDPDSLCVVARGSGFVVNVHSPQLWSQVEAYPTIDVRSVLTLRIILFATYTAVVAYDSRGLKWRTRRLAWDGFDIVELTDTHLKGRTRDSASDSMQDFVVDLKDGSHQGGIVEI
jgi:hypothetical protein